MTAAECEIVADAACHLKAIERKISDDRWRIQSVWSETLAREVSYVVGMLATLPLTTEPEEAYSVRA